MKMNKDDLIKKWLTDDLTQAELEAFEKLDDYQNHKRILEGAKEFKASEVSKIADIDAFYAKINRDNLPTETTVSWYKPFLRIAAILIIALGVGLFFFSNNDTNVSTLVSEKTTIALPDASEVFVNSKSAIVYNKNNWENEREVQLDGEAFFKVAKGARFDVVTDIGVVSVLGTQFNVKSRENYFEVQCFEGLVNVKYKEHTGNLTTGNVFRVIGGTATFEKTNTTNPQWINDISNFKSVPFYEVLREFERQYEVTFNSSAIDTKTVFTGGFVHDNLENALKSITLPLDLTYNIDNTKNITLLRKK